MLFMNIHKLAGHTAWPTVA